VANAVRARAARDGGSAEIDIERMTTLANVIVGERRIEGCAVAPYVQTTPLSLASVLRARRVGDDSSLSGRMK
jgi:hypothetical protein